MAGLPPWSFPTDYCTSMAGTYFRGDTPDDTMNKLFGLNAGNWQNIMNGCSGSSNDPCWGVSIDPAHSTLSWTSDNVFCTPGAAQFWETCLFIALAFWGFFTVLQLFSTLDIRHAHGHSMARAVNLVLRQVIVLILAIFSFFLMLLAHQLLFLVVDTMVGGNLGQWRLDSLWVPGFNQYGDTNDNNVVGGNVYMILAATKTIVSQSNPITNFLNALSNGQSNNQPDILGTTFGQLFNAIPQLQTAMNQGWPMIDFLITLLLTCTAPLAIVFMGFEYTRPAFNLWVKSATELVGLTLITAAAVGVYQHLVCGGGKACNIFADNGYNGDPNQWFKSYYHDGSFLFHDMGPTTIAWLFLGFSGLVVGLEIAYMWRLVGNFINFGTSASQAEYNRDVAAWKMALNAIGFLTTLVGGAIGLIGGTAGATLVGGIVSDVGNGISNTGQGVMSMIPQAGGGTMAALPAYSDRGLASSRFDQSAVYTDTNEPVSVADLAAALKPANRVAGSESSKINPRGNGGFTYSTSFLAKVNGREIMVTNSRTFGKPGAAEPLTYSQTIAAYTVGARNAAAFTRSQGLQPVAGGGQAIGLNHLVTQNQLPAPSPTQPPAPPAFGPASPTQPIFPSGGGQSQPTAPLPPIQPASPPGGGPASPTQPPSPLVGGPANPIQPSAWSPTQPPSPLVRGPASPTQPSSPSGGGTPQQSQQGVQPGQPPPAQTSTPPASQPIPPVVGIMVNNGQWRSATVENGKVVWGKWQRGEPPSPNPPPGTR